MLMEIPKHEAEVKFDSSARTMAAQNNCSMRPMNFKYQCPLRDSQGISSSSCSFCRAQSWKMTKELNTAILGHNYSLYYSEGRERQSQELSSHPACPGFQKFWGRYPNGSGRKTSKQNAKPNKAGVCFARTETKSPGDLFECIFVNNYGWGQELTELNNNHRPKYLF